MDKSFETVFKMGVCTFYEWIRVEILVWKEDSNSVYHDLIIIFKKGAIIKTKVQILI